MSEESWAKLKQRVYERAAACCEYCQTSEENCGQMMTVDHIDPNGGDTSDNLCLCCWNCNTSKHKATTAPDPETKTTVSLYNPRIHNWSEHFEWIENGAQVQGHTPIGRATVIRLKMNRPAIVTARKRWITLGYHPPKIEKT